ncbi:Protein CBR-OCR-2 [Caenorhabditis briggsae]|uniref:Protein CBR-OCR-2 n=1 Tax=Caenorhabditis briggsae TaxID=6238 RepID=A8WRC4_CAEBR|nr:Protein CBR-OCR-2 [Caenorhabditis briggsae]CAP23032.2 Protein CBR-OCR-2 [Caenorhabditis briggsae]
MGSASSTQSSMNNFVGMGRLREDMKIYQLVDMHGGGELLPWLRYAITSSDTSFIDAYLETKVKEFLYNQGKGKLVTVTELVKLRNKERNERLGAFSRKKGKGKSGPNVLDDFNQEGENVGDLKKALKLLDGGGKGGRNESKYREISWKLEERGSMGETIIGCCLLHASDIHNALVYKILEYYPKLLNDIHISEDFYGLSPLHQAIINTDCKLVFKFLKLGADVNSRCYGAFFCADDQKASRTDSLEHEYVELSLKTNYTGNMYLGEYPLSFAACLNQPEMFRLLLAFKANPNAQDTNGNTVLHMCVIHENMAMFKLALECGASLRTVNKQSLSPLTLAAKLAKKEMFTEILELEGDSIWAYGDASSTAYPLAKIDTINETSGELNEASALSLVVYGQTVEHLELLDGLLDTLLEAKWEAFAKRNMIVSFTAFTLYYVCFVTAFTLRPIGFSTEMITEGWINRYSEPFPGRHGAEGQTIVKPIINTTTGLVEWNEAMTQCHLRQYFDPNIPFANAYIRLVFEVFVVIGIIIQMFLDFRDIKRIGRKKWWTVLSAFPAKITFKVTYFLVIAMVPIRLACQFSPILLVIDNVLVTVTMIFTTVHYLYYCRVIRFVGPFVLMVYTIIATDIFRFMLIYGIFLMGFSQAFSLIFLSCEREANTIKALIVNQSSIITAYDTSIVKNAEAFENVIQSPIEAFVRTFILTIGEFTVLYRNLALCPANTMVWIGKFNMLIAMMTRTYETIFQTQLEYKRQRAQVILMLELSLSPKERHQYLLKYSRPTGTNKKTRSLVVSKKSSFNRETKQGQRVLEEKMKKIIEEKKAVLKRKMKDMEIKEGIRPVTGYSRTPRPHTQYMNRGGGAQNGQPTNGNINSNF